MKIARRLVVTALALVIAAASLTGCAAYNKRKQLEAVARDWCYTIRASQVIPVYPLTEDLQPGDVFLVQLPVERQQELYRQKGFLPLDYHLARLDPDYRDFYDYSFFENPDETPRLPRAWIRPPGGIESWSSAPNASFPSYSFSVKRGGGLNVAFPVQGIPVGLSLMGAEAADGSISISEAHTLGVDVISLAAQVRDWARDNRSFLTAFAPATPDETPTNFIRVVNRVYVTGKVDISLSDSSSAAGGADVGAPRPVSLLKPTAPNAERSAGTVTLGDYQSGLEQMNAMLAQAIEGKADDGHAAANAAAMMPGGSLRVTAAGARRISLQQTFDKPLILGYIGFDVPIEFGGLLGPPIPTHSVIDTEFDVAASPSSRGAVYRGALNRPAYLALEAEAKTHPRGEAAQIVSALNALADQVPASPVEYVTRRGAGLTVIQQAVPLGPTGRIADEGERTYLDVLAYRGALRQSVRLLARALASDTFTYTDMADVTTTVDRDSPLRETLAREHDALVVTLQTLTDDPVHRTATDAAIRAVLDGQAP